MLEELVLADCEVAVLPTDLTRAVVGMLGVAMHARVLAAILVERARRLVRLLQFHGIAYLSIALQVLIGRKLG